MGSKGKWALSQALRTGRTEGEGLPVVRWRCVGSRVEEWPMKV